MFSSCLVALIAALTAVTTAQTSSRSISTVSTDGSIILSGTNYASGGDYATGTFNSYITTVSLETSNSYTTTNPNATLARNVTITMNGTVLTTPSATQTLLMGTAVSNTTTTRSAGPARQTNTTPCNGYVEFCSRQYSNISMVCAHNSPFHIRGNIASNQALDVTTQLNDGIRMLQFQTHKPNDTSAIMLCHTSCDLLNAGTLVAYLTTVRQWLDNNPYDVVTILMGNDDVLKPQEFIDPVVESGMINYAYTPPTVPMPLDSWPTLGEMILTQRRAVIMLDYEADQSEIPWLLDEFAQMWETPFSPTDRAFPCTVDRPPQQDQETSSDRMYMVNHNLNLDVSLAGITLLVPATPLLNETNAVSGYGSLGAQSTNCTRDWNRPPNFFLVDYYNIGNFNGSVFQVAADANGVSYNKDSCCGLGQRDISAASALVARRSVLLAAVVSVSIFIWYGL